MCSRRPSSRQGGCWAATAHSWNLNISHRMLRATFYDGQGYWLAQKRLSKGRFAWWPESNSEAKRLEAYEAQLLMVAGDVRSEEHTSALQSPCKLVSRLLCEKNT